MNGIGDALRFGNAPFLSGGANQHEASSGSGLAERVEKLANRVGAVGILRTVGAIAISLDDSDAGPVGIEFIGEDTRQAGADSVAHLRTVSHDVYRAVAVYADEEAGVECGSANRRRGVRRLRGCSDSGRTGEKGDFSDAKHERAGGKHALKKTAAAHIFDDEFICGYCFCADHAVSFAACLMAERMRW